MAAGLGPDRQTIDTGLFFDRLTLSNWRQFADVDIDFHPNLTVLTGENGSGKSTILNILARHVGQERPYLSVPIRDESSGALKWVVGQISNFWRKFRVNALSESINYIGFIQYSDQSQAQIQIPSNVTSPQYGIDVRDQQQVSGIVLSSHRLMPQYQQLQHISFQGISPEEAFNLFRDEANRRYAGSQADRSLMFQIKQALASWAAMGEGNSVLQPNMPQKEAYSGFVEVLRKLLPPSLGFITLSIRPPDVVLVTRTGEFLIDSSSGGVTSIIEVAALIYACSITPAIKGRRFVVVYDEPENHLHPQLQRSLLRNLTEAFPRAQFIVATHSPFIVSSLKESNVYVLRYQSVDDPNSSSHAPMPEQRRVVSEQLDHVNRAGPASEILREVLGLPSTLPEWVENDLDQIVSKYQTRKPDENLIDRLKEDLERAGLSDLFPEALVRASKQR